MFEKLMNRYYYGKSGKGDFTENDLPATRWQLFWEMLRIRLSALIRLNLMYAVIWLPAMIVITMNVMGFLGAVNTAEDGTVPGLMNSMVFTTLLMLAPCIAITGPATSGVAYVTRNWARDEHAFIWADFKDAVKENWKQSLPVSVITGIAPLLVYTGWQFYGQLAENNVLLMVPQALIMMVGVIVALSVTYAHPMLVTYRMSLKDVLRNSVLMALARLPMSVGIRLLHCVPAIIGVVCFLQWPLYASMGLFLYYLVIGFGLSRFVTASYTNAVFDKLLNPRVGAEVNRGLRREDEDEDDDEYEDASGSADAEDSESSGDR